MEPAVLDHYPLSDQADYFSLADFYELDLGGGVADEIYDGADDAGIWDASVPAETDTAASAAADYRFYATKADATHIAVSSGSGTYVNTVGYGGTASQVIAAASDIYILWTFTTDGSGNVNGISSAVLDVEAAGATVTNDATHFYMLVANVGWSGSAITTITSYTQNNVTFIICGTLISPFAAP
jgi:hypothetical protein